MEDQSARSRHALAGPLITILGVIVATAAAVYFFYCPCGNLSGGYLLGDEVAEAVTDWSFANDIPLCQIQVKSWLPHSVNLNCMSAAGELYLSCGSCLGKSWSQAALANPRARIRLGDKVYPVTLTRVTDPVVLQRAWTARTTKIEQPNDTPMMEGWWSFHAVSR